MPQHFLAGHIGKWQGRQRPSSMEFSSRRPASPAATWAWRLGNPSPLYAEGITSETHLRRHAATHPRGLQATTESRDQGDTGGRLVQNSALRPLSAMSGFASESQAFRQAKSPDSTSSLSFRPGSESPAQHYDTLRPKEAVQASDFSVLGYGRPHTAHVTMRDSFRERPAGLSKTPAGQELGLNVKASQTRPLRPASAMSFSANAAATAQHLRFVHPPATYLLQLDQHKANAGCTKHVPGRRFVDFVSLSQGALVASKAREREEEERDAGGARARFFSATSRSVPPPSEPYKLRKAYGGGGTCYTEFNRSCLTGHTVCL